MRGKGVAVLGEDPQVRPVEGMWVWDRAGETPAGMATCWFRRRFKRGEVGRGAVLQISADSRYRAYLNGKLISRGPCRGQVDRYFYETVKLDALLIKENVLAIEVRWYGRFAPASEVHLKPGLWANIRDGAGILRLGTDKTWKVMRSLAHAPEPIPAQAMTYYIPEGVTIPEDGVTHAIDRMCYTVVDPCEDVDLRQVPAGWRDVNFDDSRWGHAVRVEGAYARYAATTRTGNAWELVPREIPPLEESPVLPAGIVATGTIEPTQPPEKIRQIAGSLRETSDLPPAFWGPAGKPLELPGSGTHFVIVNMGELRTGYPRVRIHAPAGTIVELRYSEALSRNFQKSVRDEAGTVEGYADVFTCSDGENVIEPFVWRTFRFLRIAVHHPAGPARIDNLQTIFSAFPLAQRSTFASSDPLHQQLWDVSWRTARLCAHEHYVDCPYYEQLQYIGDTRLQMLVSYLAAGDFRLAKAAIRQWAATRRADGMIASRGPASGPTQIMSQFGPIWIEAVEDYFRYSGDATLVQEVFDTVTSVLKWFDRFDRGGILRDVPYWIFTDWTLPSDVTHTAGSMGEMNLRRLGGLLAGARLAAAMGRKTEAVAWTRQIAKIKAALRAQLRSRKDGLFLDHPNGELLSEHPTVLAVLFDVVAPAEGRKLLETLERRQDLAKTTIYYTYYKFRAYEKLGLYPRAYQKFLHHWTDMLKLHATTWFEMPEPTRSDCHGWGAWIACDLLTSVLGITPAAPGFARVHIAPQPLDLAWARGTMATVRGPITVGFKRNADRVDFEVSLPKGISGEFVYAGKRTALKAGTNQIQAGA